MRRARRTARHAGGFTLLELLVVLTLVGLILGLAAPRLSAGVPGVTTRAAVRDVAALLQTARSRAVTEQRLVTVEMQPRLGSLALDGESLRLDESIRLEAGDGRSEPVRLRFHPDGSSSGGTLRLESAGHRYRVDLDWLTGRVRIERGAEHG